jgi:hypothetical protein
MSTIVSDNNRTAGKRNKHLKFLDNLSGYQVHHDDVDPRGYTVKLSSGEKIGEVEGLLADTRSNLVRYVELEIEDDVINRHTAGRYHEEDRHALIPVGLIHINAGSNSVDLRGLTLDHLVDYPRFRKDQGYTTRYEIDTNDYLAGFHDYGSSYDRNTYSTDRYRTSDELDDTFYSSQFYTNRKRNTTV